MISITIITDASFCPNTKAAGYGVWIASQHGRKAFKGMLEKATDNNVAEAMAIGNALWHGCQSGLIKRGSNILIQSDSETAIRVAKGEYAGKNPQLIKVMRYVLGVQERFGLVLRYKHVPGHTKGEDSRTRSQIQCDRDAGEQMQLMRARILKEAPVQVEVTPVRKRGSTNFLRSRRRVHG